MNSIQLLGFNRVVKLFVFRLAFIFCLFFTAALVTSCHSDPHYRGYRGSYYGSYYGGYYGGYYGPPPVSYTAGYYYRNQYYRFHEPRYSGRHAYPSRSGASGGGGYHYPREGGGSAGSSRPNQGRGNASNQPVSGRGGSVQSQGYYNPRAGVYGSPPPRGNSAPPRSGAGGGGRGGDDGRKRR